MVAMYANGSFEPYVPSRKEIVKYILQLIRTRVTPRLSKLSEDVNPHHRGGGRNFDHPVGKFYINLQIRGNHRTALNDSQNSAHYRPETNTNHRTRAKVAPTLWSYAPGILLATGFGSKVYCLNFLHNY